MLKTAEVSQPSALCVSKLSNEPLVDLVWRPTTGPGCGNNGAGSSGSGLLACQHGIGPCLVPACAMHVSHMPRHEHIAGSPDRTALNFRHYCS